jgi:hypothetical protein
MPVRPFQRYVVVLQLRTPSISRNSSFIDLRGWFPARGRCTAWPGHSKYYYAYFFCPAPRMLGGIMFCMSTILILRPSAMIMSPGF